MSACAIKELVLWSTVGIAPAHMQKVIEVNILIFNIHLYGSENTEIRKALIST